VDIMSRAHLYPRVAMNEKRAFGSPSTTVGQLYLLYGWKIPQLILGN